MIFMLVFYFWVLEVSSDFVLKKQLNFLTQLILIINCNATMKLLPRAWKKGVGEGGGGALRKCNCIRL